MNNYSQADLRLSSTGQYRATSFPHKKFDIKSPVKQETKKYNNSNVITGYNNGQIIGSPNLKPKNAQANQHLNLTNDL